MNVQRTVLKTVLALCLISTLVGVGMTSAKQMPQADRPAQPRVIAVRYHADWCNPCRTLAPSFDKLQAAVRDEPVLFVTLDFTDDKSKKQAEYLAAVLNLDKIWQSNGMETGRVLLIDRAQNQVVETLLSTDNLKQMQAKLKGVLDIASE